MVELWTCTGFGAAALAGLGPAPSFAAAGHARAHKRLQPRLQLPSLQTEDSFCCSGEGGEGGGQGGKKIPDRVTRTRRRTVRKIGRSLQVERVT